MIESDTAFTGSIPALYDRCLGPLLFQPYARDLAERAAALAPRRILETAAGTGIVTAALVRALPDADIVATDLNPDMLVVAAAKIDSPRVIFQPADAGNLPFADGAFDLVICQFGAMFFPDRVATYAEALRVLKRGGLFLFNVWDRLDRNLLSKVTADAVARLTPDGGVSFIERVPFGYHDPARIERELVGAGFHSVGIETVVRTTNVTDPAAAAHGICAGSPLAVELETRGIAVADAEAAVAEALGELAGAEGLDLPMSALVISARA